MQFRDGQEVNSMVFREILVYLASEGVFNNYDVPDWGVGTTVEDVFLALRGLSERSEAYGYGQGVRKEFDDWFRAYCDGKEVVEPHLIVLQD